MKTTFTLPEHYTRIYRINMKQKKFALWLNLAAAVCYIALMLLGMLFHPISLLFDMSDGLGMYALRFGVLLVGYFVYIILHEAIHGIVIRLYSGRWGSFGFTGLYAFAGSPAYFPKVPYIVIALSPVVIFGVIFVLLNALLPAVWFWPIYLIACGNLSGAAGDLFVTFRFLGMPRDILVKDEGVVVEVFAPKTL